MPPADLRKEGPAYDLPIAVQHVRDVHRAALAFAVAT